MTLEELITKCNIGEEHLTCEEYEQVGKYLEELKEYKLALHQAAVILANWMPRGGTASVVEEALMQMAKLKIKQEEEGT